MQRPLKGYFTAGKLGFQENLAACAVEKRKKNILKLVLQKTNKKAVVFPFPKQVETLQHLMHWECCHPKPFPPE